MAGYPFPSSRCLQSNEDVLDREQGHAAGARLPCVIWIQAGQLEGPSTEGTGLGDAEDLGTWAEAAKGGNSRSGEEQKNWRCRVMS